MKNTIGKVLLVGAGPGDPELLTLKAWRAIKEADVIVYDRLVSEAIMALIDTDIPLHFVGKSCKQKAMPQEEIQQLLAKLALEGKKVVRLKGGDPFFFGRGGEEALHLLEQNVPFEIIPGITSAQGCAAYAGIPLTHRGLATGVAYITGHRNTKDEAQEPLDLNWKQLADPDTTLVIYMGLANLPIISEKLIEYGLPATTPAASISNGTTNAQRVCLAQLDTLGAETQKMQLESPVLVIIGRVAALHEQLKWFTTEPSDNQSEFDSAFTKM